MEHYTPDERYRSVRISLAPESKSSVPQDAELIKRAVLFAIDANSGEIARYGSNMGSLSGKPVILETDTPFFEWLLPLDTPLDIYAIVNQPENFWYPRDGTNLNENSLKAMEYEFKSGGAIVYSEALPMAGVLPGLTVSADSEVFDIYVKYLVAKYRFRILGDTLPEGCKYSIDALEVVNANTVVPYFQEGFRQEYASRLAHFDYALTDDLLTLEEGGEIVLYAAENCHGTKAGASSWLTVHEDLSGSWDELSKCTMVLLRYTLSGQSGGPCTYTRRIYLGEGDMCSNFNVRRNIEKAISVNLGEGPDTSDPYFRFLTEGPVYMAPGSTLTLPYDSNLRDKFSATPLIWIFDGDGNSTQLVSISAHDSYGKSVTLKADSRCTHGQVFTIRGGSNGGVYVADHGEAIRAMDTRSVIIDDSPELVFSRADDGEIHPYRSATYKAGRLFTWEKASALLETCTLECSTQIIDYSRCRFYIKKEDFSQDYGLYLDIFPVLPGDASFCVRYRADGGKTSNTVPVTVKDPMIVHDGTVHVCVDGTKSVLDWHLEGSDSNSYPIPEGCSFGCLSKDSGGTDLCIEATSAEASYEVYLKGFSGLKGFTEGAYTFSGMDIACEAKLLYPNGHSVSGAATVHIDNPAEGLHLDGATMEYRVKQGQTGQESFVSATGGDYKVEYMLEWPERRFTVDLTRGGTRSCSDDMDIWTEYSRIPGLESRYTLSGGKFRFMEDLSHWGPIYFGKSVTNRYSLEKIRLVHSVVRLYSRFNVFACLDACEQEFAHYSTSDMSSVNWHGDILSSGPLGCVEASWKANFAKGGYLAGILSALVLKDIPYGMETTPPLLKGFSVDAKRSYRTDSQNTNWFVCSKGSPISEYFTGWYNCPDPGKYRLYYSCIECWAGLGINFYFVFNWRVMAAYNAPWFTLSGGDTQAEGYYVSRLVREQDGSYSFCAVRDKNLVNLYRDPDGRGYLSILPFWEDKEGRFITSVRNLSPLTGYSANVCLMNGWYDPSPYTNGVPAIQTRKGMYFFPESDGADTRFGFPGYYPTDRPMINNVLDYEADIMPEGLDWHMELDLEFGELYSRENGT